MSKTDIRKLLPDELADKLTALGMQKFRARQVYEWLWTHQAVSFDEMTSLPKTYRSLLHEHFAINPVQIATSQESTDGTVKYAFRLHDNHVVEGVLIPTENRLTACISSQAGCSLDCSFCGTGKLKMMRNLDAAEIYDQVAIIDREARLRYGKGLTNIVYMGMGEPLLNYTNMLRSVELITGKPGMEMSAKRITVSTAGIAKAIRRLADDKVKFNLALSLHAADDAKRSEIMSINDSNNLTALIEALRYFYEKTKNRITFEYILFDRFNDTPEDARKLAAICKKVPAKVNIIEYNPINLSKFRKSNIVATDRFQKFLESRGITAKIRRSRGRDIDAACGQLANKNKAVRK